MSVEECTRQTLWPILVETVHALVMYLNHKAYTRDMILPEKSDVNATELATRLRIPRGEAMVILFELSEERKGSPRL